MSNSSITKEAIALAFKRILETQPLSKVSIKDITEYCNISRNTFYYHFKDKYDLISWIFHSDMLTHVNSFTDPVKLSESFCNVCKCLYVNRKFYLACFQYVGQNSLYESLLSYYYELWKINIDMKYTEHGFKLSEDELNILAKLKAHAFVGVISDWVKDGMDDDYMKYFEQIHNVLELESTGYAVLSEYKMTQNNVRNRPVYKEGEKRA